MFPSPPRKKQPSGARVVNKGGLPEEPRKPDHAVSHKSLPSRNISFQAMSKGSTQAMGHAAVVSMNASQLVDIRDSQEVKRVGLQSILLANSFHDQDCSSISSGYNVDRTGMDLGWFQRMNIQLPATVQCSDLRAAVHEMSFSTKDYESVIQSHIEKQMAHDPLLSSMFRGKSIIHPVSVSFDFKKPMDLIRPCI